MHKGDSGRMQWEILVAATQAQRALCMDIRMAVFVDEQQVPPDLEPDDYDAEATHFLMLGDNEPIATARLVDKKGIAKIGRVAVVRAMRGHGAGLAVMNGVLEYAQAHGFREAVLDSQTYAIPFYERLGFTAEGDEFDDAGILHRLMRRQLAAASG